MADDTTIQENPASFRDPSGFVFKKNDGVLRQINKSYSVQYEHLMSSGLYANLIEDSLLVAHTELNDLSGFTSEKYKIIEPQPIPFISFPYEWCFSQLKDAALLTLEIQKRALSYGMSLKDASAYNIQFIGYQPIYIDTLSFEFYPENKPWVAYRQFCQHFLAPLAVMAKVDINLGVLSQSYIDGLPLELASHLLPSRTKLALGLGSHIHLHARSQNQHAHQPKTVKDYALSKERLIALLANLESTVRGLKLPAQKTVWQDYYENTNYTPQAAEHKKEVIGNWLTRLKPSSVWDAGANDGTFSSLSAERGSYTVASDIDPMAVEIAYKKAKDKKATKLLPLIIDITAPSPAIGWHNTERPAFLKRGTFDVVLCLAFVHHLAIANNIPLHFIAQLFSEQATFLIIEFVPKEDSNAARLLAVREDIFPEYTATGFEKEFSHYFSIEKKELVKETNRILYLLKKKAS